MDNFNKYLSSVELIDINMDTEHWTERVYIDKQTRKPIGLVVSPGIFMKYYIYFDETTCKELYSDPFDDTFHTFGINWFIYKGISEQDTKYGQELLHKSIEHSKKIFNYIKTKIEIDGKSIIVSDV